MPRPDLKTTFNTVASLYDEVRPGYPDELVRDVLELSEMDRSGKILEVGCGTGQASRLFAALGCEMTCLDIGQDLIEVARARLNNYKNVRFVLCPFEDWDSASKFDLVISATAFRWVSPRVRFIRARDALKARGSLAVFSNQHVGKDEGFFAEVQEVYSEHYVVSDSPRDPSNPTTSDPLNPELPLLPILSTECTRGQRTILRNSTSNSLAPILTTSRCPNSIACTYLTVSLT